MAKTTSELFKDRISFTYEYNKKSPLFIRIANWEIEDNNTLKAIEILNEGLKEYPDFAAAHFILGKAYTALGEYTNALKYFKKGSELIQSPKSYDHYLRELEIKKQQPLDKDRFNTSSTTGKPDTNLKSEDIELIEDKKLPVDDRLGELANEISQAKIPEITNEVKTDNSQLKYFSNDSLIVSETLAKIYIAQGEFKEAVEVYEKLKKKHPEKKDYYSEKMNEVKTKLNPPAAD